MAGRTVVRRYWRAGRIGFLNAVRVVADDERGLRLWQPAGTKYWRLLTPDGRTHHDGTIDQLGDLTLTELTWRGSDMLVFMPLGEAWSVWFFEAAGFPFDGAIFGRTRRGRHHSARAAGTGPGPDSHGQPTLAAGGGPANRTFPLEPDRMS